MDRNGITTQVLSRLNMFLPADVAPALTRTADDTAARAVGEHPGRFAAFATLPTAVRTRRPTNCGGVSVSWDSSAR